MERGGVEWSGGKERRWKHGEGCIVMGGGRGKGRHIIKVVLVMYNGVAKS